jgi:hypothetical protein
MTGIPAPLAPHLRRDLSPEEVFGDYIDVVKRTIDNHPRSLQDMIGPSEVGDPCARRIGYKLLGTPERPKAPNWKATIGTAGHAWMESAFDGDNLRLSPNLEGQERWLIESELVAGYIDGLGLITGHSDLYDRVSDGNWDHKFVGPDQMRKYRTNGPGLQYKVQAHIYGQGWKFAGYPVRYVGISFLPRQGELAEAFPWAEPFDPAAAKWGLDRLTSIWRQVQVLGDGAPAVLETEDAYCSGCPFLRPGADNLAVGCPGHPGSRAATPPPAALTFGHAAQPALA